MAAIALRKVFGMLSVPGVLFIVEYQSEQSEFSWTGNHSPVCRQVPKFDVIDDRMAAVLREKTEWERLEIGFAMWHSAQSMIRAIVTAEHPEWTEKEIERQVAKRMSHGAV